MWGPPSRRCPVEDGWVHLVVDDDADVGDGTIPEEDPTDLSSTSNVELRGHSPAAVLSDSLPSVGGVDQSRTDSPAISTGTGEVRTIFAVTLPSV